MDPKKKKTKNIAIAKPKSPILFTINAFIAALFAVSFYTKNLLINKNIIQLLPTKKSCKKLSETTNASIEKVNNER